MTDVSIKEKILAFNWFSDRDLSSNAEEIKSFIKSLDEKDQIFSLILLIDSKIEPSTLQPILIEFGELLKYIRDTNKLSLKKFPIEDKDLKCIYTISDLFTYEEVPITSDSKSERAELIELSKLKEMALKLQIIKNEQLMPYDWLENMTRFSRDHGFEKYHKVNRLIGLLRKRVARKVWQIEAVSETDEFDLLINECSQIEP
jgi:hypothetical protein